MNRRDFFKIVTVSGAAAASGGCQQASETILPLVVPNEQLVPGVASWFATVCRECPAGCGVIARNREGRIVKLEGNPDHPVNAGALCMRGQAALQGLYHPDRIAGPLVREGSAGFKSATWDAASKMVSDRIAALKTGGKGRAIAVVTQLENGSLGGMLDRWVQALGARPRVTLEPFAYESIRAANRLTFNRDAIPYYAFEDAEVVLSFGADFIETWLSNVNYARTFARMHSFRDGRAGTFIHVEPRQSLTASNADEWVRNAPGTEGLLALAILRVMVDEGTADKRFSDAVASIDLKRASDESGVGIETIKHIAKVFAHGKPGLAVGGGVSVTGTNATQTQVAINLLNAAAGQRRQDRAVRRRLGLREGHPVCGGGQPRGRDGERRGRGAHPGPGREPGLHLALRAQAGRRDPQGRAGRQLRERSRPDQRARPRRPARHALARVVGRLLAA
jgi:molybdopterin-containing oxidoreductase family iron-sulfur binding subunit